MPPFGTWVTMPGTTAASKKSRYGLSRVGFGIDRDPVALHLDEQVVEIVAVDGAALARAS